MESLGDENVTANITDALLRAQWLSGKGPEVAYA